MHGMLDIETLGVRPDNAVLSAGVIFFDPETEERFGEELFLFDPRQQPDRPIDFETMKWWMNQSQAARAHWEHATFPPIDRELRRFADFCGSYADVTWWGNSPAFDQIIMENIMESFHVEVPWNFWKWRDVRTIKDFLLDGNLPKNKNAHDPIADCVAQIEVVCRFYREQNEIGEFE